VGISRVGHSGTVRMMYNIDLCGSVCMTTYLIA
jgi:hypothetical protein